MKHLTTAEFAEKVGRTRQTVYNWCRSGLIEADQFAGVYRIPLSELSAGKQLCRTLRPGRKKKSINHNTGNSRRSKRK